MLDEVTSTEMAIQRLKAENKNIYNNCILIKSRSIRNKQLIRKIDNEKKIIELEQVVSNIRNKHLKNFTELEKLRDNVDKNQNLYDESIKNFKENIGLNDYAVSSLMVGIYNKYQDEILKNEVN